MPLHGGFQACPACFGAAVRWCFCTGKLFRRGNYLNGCVHCLCLLLDSPPITQRMAYIVYTFWRTRTISASILIYGHTEKCNEIVRSVCFWWVEAAQCSSVTRENQVVTVLWLIFFWCVELC